MKKLLYITVNSKPENLSTSRQVGREFVNRFLQSHSDYSLEELDLYHEEIPEINHRLFNGRGELVSGDAYHQLSDHEKWLIDRIHQLCDQFLRGDVYVIAAPMWSISFPSRLKRYLDCIILNKRLIYISDNHVEGLLDNKERQMVYIQSSGGVYPRIFDGIFNHGADYLHDIFTFLGVNKFHKILVQGVNETGIGREKAMQKAYEDMDCILGKMSKRIPVMAQI